MKIKQELRLILLKFMKGKATVLIIGNGAREHTISKAYEKSSKVGKIIVAPGNDFIAYKREKEILVDKNCSVRNLSSILDVALKFKPDLIDVAQDDALSIGAVDLLMDYGFRVFGPTKKASEIEWDKKWSREFMQRYSIRHPDFMYFNSETNGVNYIKKVYQQKSDKLLYVKAVGLCSGKGSKKSTNVNDGIKNVESMKHLPNDSGKIFLIEEGLVGEEFSFFAICDGTNFYCFKSSQDNKTVYNFDKGDQTGGMGAISPAMVTSGFEGKIAKEFILKALCGLEAEGRHFKGILYLGGIIVGDEIYNLEYNARWGDPECQVVLPALKSDYFDLVNACIDGKLQDVDFDLDEGSRVCVVAASKGYPGNYENVKGKAIYGLENILEVNPITVCGAGIKMSNNKFYADGGRLFSVVGMGKDILEAKSTTYYGISNTSIEGNNLHYRIDIGWRDIERYFKKR